MFSKHANQKCINVKWKIYLNSFEAIPKNYRLEADCVLVFSSYGKH